VKNEQMKMEKCGIYTWFGFVIPFPEKLRLIKEAGFDTICTWWDDMFVEIDGRKEEHFSQALAAGLYLEHTHLPYDGCDELWRPGMDGDTLCEQYCKGVSEAAESGIGTVVMHPFERFVPENGIWEVFSARMERIAGQSAEKQIRLAIENLPDRKGFMHIVDHLNANPYVGICFDTGHNHVTIPNDFELLERYQDRIFALHVHDNHGTSDEHLLPYSGTIDWMAFKRTIEKTGFGGSLMLESCYPIDMEKFDKDPAHEYQAPPIPPEEYLADAKRCCEKVLQIQTED
jgi:sugar phosphate isomerase/epimerase